MVQQVQHPEFQVFADIEMPSHVQHVVRTWKRCDMVLLALYVHCTVHKINCSIAQLVSYRNIRIFSTFFQSFFMLYDI